MKIFSLICCLAFSFSPAPLSRTDNEVYARITNNETYFYFSLDENDKGFLLPNSYFVLLLENASENFYRARYIDQMGYVKKNEVTPVIGTPLKPFADEISFRVFSLNGLNLRSSPDSSSPFNIINSVPYLEKNLVFYGTTIGETAIENKTNIWYYCKYINGSQTYNGYLYSVFCDTLTPIVLNTEVFENLLEPPFVDDKPTSTEGTNNFSLTTPVQILIAVGVSLPCIFLIYLLFRPTKLITENPPEDKKTKKRKIKKLKKADYYEIED